MKTRTQTINELIESKGYSSYLEIGLGNCANFNAVKCENKLGVDPNVISLSTYNFTSDYFFSENTNNYDLIFIDGLHHADQVERDIVNAWNCLNKGGMILIHDVKPPSYDATIVPRKQNQWTGDVFKAWHGFKETYPKIKTGYIEEKYGLGVIEKSRHKIEIGFVSDISYKEYIEIEGWK